MLKLYNLIIQIFSLAIKAHALFNNKSREWKNGRKKTSKNWPRSFLQHHSGHHQESDKGRTVRHMEEVVQGR